MFTHAQIWQSLDRLAESRGLSASGLAKRAGLDPTSFNKSKRVSPDGKPRWPSTESLSKVLAVTNASMAELVCMIDAPANTPLGKDDKVKIANLTARSLIETESVLFNAKKPFVLKSGRASPVYVDCRRLISFVAERNALMDASANLLASAVGRENIDFVAGGETAGIPYGAFIAERLAKPMVYVRKQAKGHGRMAQIEGNLPKKTKKKKKPTAVLVEDLMTDGGSKEVFIDALRKADLDVRHVFVLFHYGIFDESKKSMKKLGVTLHALATWWDVLHIAKKDKYFDAQTLEAVERFLHNPHKWDG